IGSTAGRCVERYIRRGSYCTACGARATETRVTDTGSPWTAKCATWAARYTTMTASRCRGRWPRSSATRKWKPNHLLAAAPGSLSLSGRLRRMAWPAPILVFPYVLIAKRCVLDGWHGWYYSLQRLVWEILIALNIIDQKLRRSPHS